MEFTDFRVSSSSIAALLGAFGGQSRFYTMCKIWDKSVFKDTYAEFKCAESINWDSTQHHTRLLGVTDHWKRLINTAEQASTQSDITKVHTAAYELLFHNAYMIKIAESMINVLNSPGVVAILQRVFSNSQEYYLAIQELRQKQSEIGLDHLTSLLKLLDQSAKMCYSIMTRCTRAYGVQGETKFIAAHNSAYKVPIERVNRLYSKTVGSFNGITWSVDGRIDGIKNNTIIEIKHRRDEMMEQVPLYELIQLHAYMFLLEKPQAIWYQCMSNNGLQLSEQRTVPYSHAFWQSVIEQVNKCLLFVHHLHTNPITRRAFFLLSMEAREQLMSEFMGNLPDS